MVPLPPCSLSLTFLHTETRAAIQLICFEGLLPALDSHSLPWAACMSCVAHPLALKTSPSLASTLPLHTQCQSMAAVHLLPTCTLDSAYCLLSISRPAQALWNQRSSLLSWELKHTFTREGWTPSKFVLPWVTSLSSRGLYTVSSHFVIILITVNNSLY